MILAHIFFIYFVVYHIGFAILDGFATGSIRDCVFDVSVARCFWFSVFIPVASSQAARNEFI